VSPATSHWILRHRAGPAPAADLAAIHAAAGVEVLDAEGRNVLFAASRSVAERLARALPGWTLVPERTLPPPR
jgi:hypothetical protein